MTNLKRDSSAMGNNSYPDQNGPLNLKLWDRMLTIISLWDLADTSAVLLLMCLTNLRAVKESQTTSHNIFLLNVKQNFVSVFTTLATLQSRVQFTRGEFGIRTKLLNSVLGGVSFI